MPCRSHNPWNGSHDRAAVGSKKYRGGSLFLVGASSLCTIPCSGRTLHFDPRNFYSLWQARILDRMKAVYKNACFLFALWTLLMMTAGYCFGHSPLSSDIKKYGKKNLGRNKTRQQQLVQEPQKPPARINDDSCLLPSTTKERYSAKRYFWKA